MTTGTSRLIAITVVLLALIGGFLYYSKNYSLSGINSFEECRDAGYQIMESYPEQCRTPDGRTFVNGNATGTPSGGATSTAPVSYKDMIRVSSPLPNQLVSSPLVIRGEARGGWYFEASFPVELVDGNGKRLAIAPAQAQGEWMTRDYVPFSLTLTFQNSTTSTGTLILRNDNPSGLPENQEELRIPVRFSTSERSVELYYYNPNLDKDAQGNILCSAKGLVPVARSIPVTQTPLQDTLRLLLRGELTAAERSRGISTEFPLPSVTLDSASLSSNGTLTVKLLDPLERTSGGACRASILRAQVEATARQFPNVKTVRFSPETLFQP